MSGSEVAVSIGQRPLHPRHGVHRPRSALSERQPGTIRRTSTIDAHRPDGMLGDLVQHGRSRDLLTHSDGAGEVLGEASVTTRLDFTNRYAMVGISAIPDVAGLERLLGHSVSTGFRRAVVANLPDEEAAASLIHLLLDDLPGAALVSGYALLAAGAVGEFKKRRTGKELQVPGLCAGFIEGGTLVESMVTEGTAPVGTGPIAPSLLSAADPLAWHEFGVLGRHDMRRCRCLDVAPGVTAGGPVTVEAYFRDSYMGTDDVETIVHEYTVRATIDPVTEMVLSSSAEAHTLPWMECIEAEASGGLLPGRSLRGLRPNVRAEFTGITTCTHLNDTMRSLEDVRAIIGLLRENGLL